MRLTRELAAGRGLRVGSETPQTQSTDPGRARGSLQGGCRPTVLAPRSRRRKRAAGPAPPAAVTWAGGLRPRAIVLTLSACVVEESTQEGGQSGPPALKRTVSLTCSAVPVPLWP